MFILCSQLCDEIDQHEKNTQDMIEEEKKKIPGNSNKFTCTQGLVFMECSSTQIVRGMDVFQIAF